MYTYILLLYARHKCINARAFVYIPIYIYYTHTVNMRAHTAGITIKREYKEKYPFSVELRKNTMRYWMMQRAAHKTRHGPLTREFFASYYLVHCATVARTCVQNCIIGFRLQ